MRNAGRLKLGYYPLPIDEACNIRSLLVSSAPYAAIDPCVGDGTALIEITRDTGGHLTGIELDADRAEAANRNGVATVHGSAFECRVLAETCSLLYLNPPYDTEFGPHSNKRMELVFLEHCYRWVTSEGVLVFVVPAPAVGTCARLLASQFDRISVFRMEHPESVRFNQVSWCLADERNRICAANPRERTSCSGLRISRICSLYSTKMLWSVMRSHRRRPRRSLIPVCRWMRLRMRCSALWLCRTPAAFLYASSKKWRAVR